MLTVVPMIVSTRRIDPLRSGVRDHPTPAWSSAAWSDCVVGVAGVGRARDRVDARALRLERFARWRIGAAAWRDLARAATRRQLERDDVRDLAVGDDELRPGPGRSACRPTGPSTVVAAAAPLPEPVAGAGASAPRVAPGRGAVVRAVAPVVPSPVVPVAGSTIGDRAPVVGPERASGVLKLRRRTSATVVIARGQRPRALRHHAVRSARGRAGRLAR